MRRAVSWRAVLLIGGIVAVWAALLMLSSTNNVTVVSLERHITKQQNDFKNRDCYITGLTGDKKRVAGYAPSSFCSSVKVGDIVIIKDGYVTHK